MGGTDVQTSTQSQNTTQLPPWINNAAQQNYAYAQNVATQPLQQYQGQLVADMGPQTQQAINAAASGGNAGQDQYNAAQAAYQGVIGQQPQTITPNTLSGANLSSYMNPYTQSVINQTLPIMQQNLGVQQAGNAANAVGQGAFGGSRLGVQQGVTQAQGALGMAQMAAQLNQANYGQAVQGAQYDISNNLAAQQANQNAQQNQALLNLQAGQGLTNLGTAAQQNQVRNFTELTTAGQLEQQQAQNQINANYQQYQQALGYPYQQLGVLQSALGMTPYGTSNTGSSTSQTQTSANPLEVALGGLTSLGSLFSAPAGGTSGASGIASLLSSLSDRRMKTDIEKVGDHPAGVGIYAYRYKGDPKTYPKVVGPMAEDVSKIAPHAVSTIPGSGGRQAVSMAALNALAPPRSRRGAVPGPLSAPVPTGPVGGLGASMRLGSAPRIRRPRPPPLRGALGG